MTDPARTDPGGAGKYLQTALFIAGYPVVIYLLLTHHAGWIGAALVVGMIVWKIRRRHDWLWWLAGLTALAAAAAWLFGIASILKLSPLLIHTGLFLVFFQSLNDIPLIERFARLEFAELPPGIADYCRKLTLLWSCFFALNIVGCLWLAFWGNDEAWVVYNGLIVYLLIVGLTLGEYVWRHFAFPDLDIPPLLHSLSNIVRNGHKIWGAPER